MSLCGILPKMFGFRFVLTCKMWGDLFYQDIDIILVHIHGFFDDI